MNLCIQLIISRRVESATVDFYAVLGNEHYDISYLLNA
jgi:hypothetical protein